MSIFFELSITQCELCGAQVQWLNASFHYDWHKRTDGGVPGAETLQQATEIRTRYDESKRRELERTVRDACEREVTRGGLTPQEIAARYLRGED